jgi:hypothetical protein
MTLSYGFRIVGSCWERRRLVDAGAALRGYASCDPRADVAREAYLSSFTFGPDFRDQLESTGSTAGFSGDCWAPFLWWDIDRENELPAALRDARRLASFLLDRYRTLDDDDLLIFYSGAKGFHVGLPTALWGPAPSKMFNAVARSFGEQLAAAAGVAIDAGVYDKVRPFRAPNSRHPKTGLHKRRVAHRELLGLSPDKILRLAQEPIPFDLPAPAAGDDQAAADWQGAYRRIAEQTEGKTRRRTDAAKGTPTLNRLTLDFIRKGAAVGDRHRLLFSAAANLAEFDCPPALAHALLTEAALDSGLAPGDVRRQIECGLNRVRRGAANA